MNLFSRCKEKTLPSQWKWLNEPEDWHFNENHHLFLQVPAKVDFFNDPAKKKRISSAPFLYMDITGDFVVMTRVSLDMKRKYDAGCIMILLHLDCWAKLCYEYIHRKPTIVSVVTNIDSDDCISEAIREKSPYLRVAKRGDCFAFHYSLDGEEWRMVRYFSLKRSEHLRVGLMAQSPVGDGCDVVFSFFHKSQSISDDVRLISS